MADSSRADLRTRIAAPDSWDAGFHTDSEVGAIDVGLSVQPRAVGVIVEAPGVGVLRLAFDFAADGTTRVARATRRLGDGRDVAFVIEDEGRVLRLEGELARLRDEAASQQVELDARLSQLLRERDTAAGKLAELDALLTTITAERDETRDALGMVTSERNVALKDFERTKQALQAELARATAALDERRALQAELTATGAALQEARESADTSVAALQQQLEALQLELDAHRARELQQGQALAAQQTELEHARSALDDARTGAAAQAHALQAELTLARQALADAQLGAGERDHAVAALQAELEQARAALTDAQLSAGEQANAVAALQAELDQARAALTDAQLSAGEQANAVAALQAELDQARTALADAQLSTGEQASAVAAQQGALEQARTALDLAQAELQATRATHAAETAASTSTQAELAAQLTAAQRTAEALQAQLQATEARVTEEQRHTQDAREVAIKLKTQSDKALAERDEARGVARQLHQKLATQAREREEFGLKIEALGRLLEQERDGRARALADRDEWQARFKLLARGSDSNPHIDPRDETRVVSVTQPDMLAVTPTITGRPAERRTEPTDPMVPKPKGT